MAANRPDPYLQQEGTCPLCQTTVRTLCWPGKGSLSAKREEHRFGSQGAQTQVEVLALARAGYGALSKLLNLSLNPRIRIWKATEPDSTVVLSKTWYTIYKACLTVSHTEEALSKWPWWLLYIFRSCNATKLGSKQSRDRKHCRYIGHLFGETGISSNSDDTPTPCPGTSTSRGTPNWRAARCTERQEWESSQEYHSK